MNWGDAHPRKRSSKQGGKERPGESEAHQETEPETESVLDALTGRKWGRNSTHRRVGSAVGKGLTFSVRIRSESRQEFSDGTEPRIAPLDGCMETGFCHGSDL
jgi:hypothetical protein